MPKEWIESLRSALREDLPSSPWVAALATVDLSGAARARSVVCRSIEADGGLRFCTDRRSEKNKELQANPHAELVFWLAASRRQFRVAGVVRAIQDVPARIAAWQALAKTSRAMFLWPAPGPPREADEAASAKEIADDVPPPTSFEVMELAAARVELLDLRTHPHRRVRWEAQSDWKPVTLNP